jgi:hypothetical protein
MTTGIIFFITRPGCLTPTEAIPIPLFALPYAAPISNKILKREQCLNTKRTRKDKGNHYARKPKKRGPAAFDITNTHSSCANSGSPTVLPLNMSFLLPAARRSQFLRTNVMMGTRCTLPSRGIEEFFDVQQSSEQVPIKVGKH